jgi:phage shock protein C
MNKTAKRFYRSRTRKVLGGICGGIAEKWDIPPWLLRIIFLIVQLFWLPFFFLIYLFAMLLIPLEPEEELGSFQEDIRYGPYSRKRKIFDLENEFMEIERKIRRLEDYVSSGEYELKEEIKKL